MKAFIYCTLGPAVFVSCGHVESPSSIGESGHPSMNTASKNPVASRARVRRSPPRKVARRTAPDRSPPRKKPVERRTPEKSLEKARARTIPWKPDTTRSRTNRLPSRFPESLRRDGSKPRPPRKSSLKDKASPIDSPWKPEDVKRRKKSDDGKAGDPTKNVEESR